MPSIADRDILFSTSSSIFNLHTKALPYISPSLPSERHHSMRAKETEKKGT